MAQTFGGSYKDLIVWRKSIPFVDDVYTATEKFPNNELFGLSPQMQRAAVSIASNIAEGSARHSRRDFRRFLRQSRGSVAEVETQIFIAMRRRYIPRADALELLSKSAEIDRMLAGLIASLQEKQAIEEAVQALESR